MTGLGEHGLDLNFEDLEFIHEESIDENGGEGPSGGQGPSDEGLEGQEEDQQTEDEGIEDENPEGVGAGSTAGEEEQTSPQLFNSLAATLVEEGVLTAVDESSIKGIKSVEDFVKIMKDQIKAQEFSDLTATQKEILTGIREGASEDTVAQFKNAMTQLDAIDDNLITTNVEVQKDLVYQDFLSKGFSKERAAAQVDRAVKGGFLMEDAKEAHVNLKTVVTARFNASKQKDIDAAANADKKALKDAETLKETILGAKKIMDIDVPEATRKEVYEEMMRHVSINPETKKPENALMKYQRENPTEFSQKLYFLWKASKGFSDLSYFGQKKATSTIKNLERAIKESTHVAGGGDPSFNDDVNVSLLDIQDIVFPGQD